MNRLWTRSAWVALVTVANLFAADWLIYGNQSAVVRKELLLTGAAYNHPANIEQLDNGDLIIVSVAGVAEGQSTRIIAFHSTDSGESWGSPVDVTPSKSMFDPTISQAPNGDVYCFYYNGCCNDQKFRRSTDGGRTWGSEHDVSADQFALQAGEQSNCLRQPNGDFLCGWSETKNGGKGYTTVIPSGSLGTPSSWERRFAVDQFWNPDFLVVDPSRTLNGHFRRLVAFCRNEFHNVGPKWASSEDGGATWSSFEWKAPRANVGCSGNEGIAFGAAGTAVSLDLGVAGAPSGPLGGLHVIAHGSDARYCPESGCNKDRCTRWFMRVWVGDDPFNASSWHEVLELREASAGNENADCSIIQDNNRMLHLIWTGRGSKGIKYVKLDPDSLVPASIVSAVGRSPRLGDRTGMSLSSPTAEKTYTIRGETVPVSRPATQANPKRRASGTVFVSEHDLHIPGAE